MLVCISAGRIGETAAKRNNAVDAKVFRVEGKADVQTPDSSVDVNLIHGVEIGRLLRLQSHSAALANRKFKA